MAITDPAKVPKAKITSIDITSANGGLDQRGEADITPNSFPLARNVRVDEQGKATFRHGLKKWLPDTVDPAGEVFPALYNGELIYITADDGHIKFKRKTDSDWVVAEGDNVTTRGVINTFIRVLDVVLILNGEDDLGFFDLSDRKVYHFDEIPDPTSAPTATPTGITATGDHKIYYAISFNSTVGETKISPILTQTVNKARDRWSPEGTEFFTIARNNSAPSKATSWNIYASMAPEGATIQPSDMLPLALGLDLSQSSFVDNGSITFLTSEGTAPEVNSTKGPKAKYAIESQGRPFLFGVKDDPYAIYIGGPGQRALNFNISGGGYRHVLNEGTNFYPMSLIGFRNGQGVPSLTVLYSNTQGLSKQATIEEQTVDFGNTSIVIWATVEQNYGSAGVSSPYATVNYRGGLYFLSTDGFSKFDTQASLQNVLSNTRISGPVYKEVDTIKSRNLEQVVGTAWQNRIMWTIPARGFDKNNELVIYDVSNKDLAMWYTYDIPAQWVGVISPDDEPAFVYICQDNHFFLLEESFVAQDETSSGTTVPFSMEYTTALMGTNSSHNSYYAVVQAVFYLLDFLGTAQLEVVYRDRSGKMRRKTRTVANGSYKQSSGGGWSDADYLFNQHLPTKVLTWGDIGVVDNSQRAGKSSLRVRIPINAVTNEIQARVVLNPDYSAVKIKSISFEGQNLGVAPDIR